MKARSKGLFAARGIHFPPAKAIAVTVIAAFIAGIAVGWMTGLVGSNLAQPEATPSTSPTPDVAPTVEVSLPPMEPITRELDDGDRLAGITTFTVSSASNGVYVTATQDGEPTGDAQGVRYVRVDYEEGLAMNGDALADYVLSILNDPRGWGARGRYEYVPTSGAADIRVAIASPYTAAATCPNPHAASSLGITDDAPEEGAVGDASATPEPSVEPSPTAEDDNKSCADAGLVMISAYDWSAGIPTYGDDRAGSRAYLVSHGLGHVMGEEDGTCASGVAFIMTDQAQLPDNCTANPWPYPDEPVPAPSPTPEPDSDS
ncbi:DUF3152 domain-containing protein [Demequina sediminicola]|uniref:DUF3152 domain-containing protein n=1 Tax=Demequina sediminicola TaxID=1095026 RepID=UPI000784CEC5|nr:DUF3152 domain-containing protein [Demequina sediminicola]